MCDRFIDSFARLVSSPYVCIAAGETSVLEAPLMRAVLARALNLGHTATDVHEFVAWTLFRLPDNVSKTYLSRGALENSLASFNASLTLETLLASSAIVPSATLHDAFTTCHIRRQEQSCASLFADAAAVLPLKGVGPEAVAAAIESKTLSGEQATQLQAMVSSSWHLLRGGPGRGKSRLVHTLIDLAVGGGLRVIAAAPTHKALTVVQQGISEASSDHVEVMTVQKMTMSSMPSPARSASSSSSSTINKFLKFARDKRAEEPDDRPVLIIVDEASMCCLADLAGVSEYVRGLGVAYQLLMVGDDAQLPPIDRGEVFRHAAQNAPPSRVGSLIHCHRTERPDLLRFADGIASGELLDEGTGLVEVVVGGVDVGIVVARTAKEHDIIIAPTNKTCNTINAALQTRMVDESGASAVGASFPRPRPLPAAAAAAASNFHRKTFYVGDPVIYTATDPPQGAPVWLRNGIMGRVRGLLDLAPAPAGMIVHWRTSKDAETPMAVFNDTFCYFKVAPSLPAAMPKLCLEYADGIELAYCITGHKSQGSEYRTVHVVLQKGDVWTLQNMFDRRWLYTAVSRAKDSVKVSVFDANVERLRSAIARPLAAMEPLFIEYNGA